MSKPTFIPFDPDAHVRTGVVIHAAPLDGVTTGQAGSLSHATHAEPAEKGTAKPLTNHQKWKLSELAESVYEFLRSLGELKGERLEAFRQRIAVNACGSRISHASHGDFKFIQAAFLNERGRAEAARRTLVQAQATPAKIAMHKLIDLCKQTNTPANYVHTLAVRFYKGAELHDLTAKQLWTLFYTVRNNANAKAGVGSKENRFKSKRGKAA